jgi:type I restriction enzyme S subunit
MSDYPSDWSVSSLGEVAERIRRTSDDLNLDVLTISSTEGWVDQKRKWARDMAGKSVEKYTLLERGEFSYNRGNSKTYPQGCVFRLESWSRALVPNVYHSFRIVSPDINSTFLKHFFAAGGLNEQLRSVLTSSVRDNGLLNITADTFFASELPIPPLPEQKKIAEILSGIDRYREILAKKMINTSMLNNALGRQFFSSLDGERIPLGEICNPKQWQTISADQLTCSGYPVYGANGKIGYFTEYNHKDPVLAVTCRGATCGNLTLIPGFSYVTGNSMCLDSPRGDTSPHYLFHFLSWRGLKDVISGSAQPQITRSPLQAIEVILPSKEKQKEIVSALGSVSHSVRFLNSALGRIDILKQALSSDLLSGRKRVTV